MKELAKSWVTGSKMKVSMWPTDDLMLSWRICLGISTIHQYTSGLSSLRLALLSTQGARNSQPSNWIIWILIPVSGLVSNSDVHSSPASWCYFSPLHCPNSAHCLAHFCWTHILSVPPIFSWPLNFVLYILFLIFKITFHPLIKVVEHLGGEVQHFQSW